MLRGVFHLADELRLPTMRKSHGFPAESAFSAAKSRDDAQR